MKLSMMASRVFAGGIVSTIIICMFSWVAELNAQGAFPGKTVSQDALRILWYNVENLFYPEVDSLDHVDYPDKLRAERLEADREFTPEGVRHWSRDRYRKKLGYIAQVIVAAGGWEAPELVGLCEVENGRVLEDLVHHPILAPWNYAYLHREGPDHRGMDVALLYRPGRFDVSRRQWISPPSGNGEESTRLILHISGSWGAADSLDLFLAHFISRYGGASRTAPYRRKQAEKLRFLLDSCRESGDGMVIAAGDFNAGWDDWSLEPLAGSPGIDSAGAPGEESAGASKHRWFCIPAADLSRASDPAAANTATTNPAAAKPAKSYKYQGRWSDIDHFIYAGPLAGYRIEMRVLMLDALLVEDEQYGGMKPKRTYEAFRYVGGFSDHLPLLLEISRKEEKFSRSGHHPQD